ncbi:MAG TPA: cytochrome C oxidase subunit IV family protein [Vicinamibacterales bacterium]|nr:cytochrome C oxidase subunit IV family protein [Vicinamibacterales bacterium]
MAERTEHHVVSTTIYYAIFAALLALTGVTVAVAYVDLGPLNVAVAIAIACFKALIVVLYFMHVKYGTRLVKLTVIAGIYWIGILLALTLSDYLTRGWGTYGAQLQ